VWSDEPGTRKEGESMIKCKRYGNCEAMCWAFDGMTGFELKWDNEPPEVRLHAQGDILDGQALAQKYLNKAIRRKTKREALAAMRMLIANIELTEVLNASR
jgi:hypothetical protein